MLLVHDRFVYSLNFICKKESQIEKIKKGPKEEHFCIQSPPGYEATCLNYRGVGRWIPLFNWGSFGAWRETRSCTLATTVLKGMVWPRVGPCDRTSGIDDIACLFFL